MSARAIALMSLPFLLAGGFAGAFAFGWIGPGRGDGTTPLWVLASIAVVFVAGGVALLGIAADQARVTAAATLAIAIGIAVVFHWVAFGGGPREFTSRSQVGGTQVERPVAETKGRWVFGAFAIGMDVVLALWAVQWWRRRTGRVESAGS